MDQPVACKRRVVSGPTEQLRWQQRMRAWARVAWTAHARGTRMPRSSHLHSRCSSPCCARCRAAGWPGRRGGRRAKRCCRAGAGCGRLPRTPPPPCATVRCSREGRRRGPHDIKRLQVPPPSPPTPRRQACGYLSPWRSVMLSKLQNIRPLIVCFRLLSSNSASSFIPSCSAFRSEEAHLPEPAVGTLQSYQQRCSPSRGLASRMLRS